MDGMPVEDMRNTLDHVWPLSPPQPFRDPLRKRLRCLLLAAGREQNHVVQILVRDARFQPSTCGNSRDSRGQRDLLRFKQTEYRKPVELA